MRLTVLGADGTSPRAGGATSGYLLRSNGFHLWIDMGTGTMANLQRHVSLLEVDAVVISHAHPDHFVDIYPYFYARYFHPEQPRDLPLFAPPGMFERAAGLLTGPSGADISRVFQARAVEPGESFEVGPFRISTEAMMHPVPTLGLRLDDGSGVLAYSADTGPTDALVGLARDADVLVCEATWSDTREGWPPIHLTATQAGEHAARAGADRLVLTHVWPTNDRRQTAQRANEAFDGTVLMAEEGLEVEP